MRPHRHGPQQPTQPNHHQLTQNTTQRPEIRVTEHHAQVTHLRSVAPCASHTLQTIHIVHPGATVTPCTACKWVMSASPHHCRNCVQHFHHSHPHFFITLILHISSKTVSTLTKLAPRSQSLAWKCLQTSHTDNHDHACPQHAQPTSSAPFTIYTRFRHSSACASKMARQIQTATAFSTSVETTGTGHKHMPASLCAQPLHTTSHNMCNPLQSFPSVQANRCRPASCQLSMLPPSSAPTYFPWPQLDAANPQPSPYPTSNKNKK